MFIKTLAQHAAIAVALATALLAAPAAVPSASAATPTYWTFHSLVRNTCLEGDRSGNVFVDYCDGTTYQDWDWIGTDKYKQLKNRDTGLCLMTDAKWGSGGPNAVWGSSCNSSAEGQRWFFDYNAPDRGWLWSSLGTAARTSPGNEYAVYTDYPGGQIEDYWYDWY